MIVDHADGWEHHLDGSHLSVPINPHRLDEIREWCEEHCQGDFLIDLGQRIIFQRSEDAALVTLMWWCGGACDATSITGSRRLP